MGESDRAAVRRPPGRAHVQLRRRRRRTAAGGRLVVLAASGPGVAPRAGPEQARDGPEARAGAAGCSSVSTAGRSLRRTDPCRSPRPRGPAPVEHLEALQGSRWADLPIGTWSSGGREAGPAAGAGLRPAHLPVRPERVGQDVRARGHPRAAPARHGPAHGGARPQRRLRAARPGATRRPGRGGRRLAEADVRVLGTDPTCSDPLRMRFAAMPRHAQAAVLQLDPIADRGEYNHFLHLLDGAGPQEVGRGRAAPAPTVVPTSGRWRSASRTSGCPTGTCGPASCRRRWRSCEAAPG